MSGPTYEEVLETSRALAAKTRPLSEIATAPGKANGRDDVGRPGAGGRAGGGVNLTSNGKNPTLEVGFVDECDPADLLTEDGDDELTYLPLLEREGYIVGGWSHLLASYPRVGKTDLLVENVGDWLRAGKRVLFFTEEPRSLWRHRIKQREAWRRGLRLVFGLGTAPRTLLELVERAPEEVVIVDTIRNLLALQDERDNSEVARVLNPWIAAARRCGKTLLLVHHMRKGSGEHGEGIAGGHALLGAVDVALELLHEAHGAPNRRRIRAYARLIQPPELLYERTAAGGLRALGEPDEVTRAEVERRVLAELTDEWKKTAEVCDGLADPMPSRELVRRALTSLARVGTIERDPAIELEQVSGKTVRWRLPTSPATTGTQSWRSGSEAEAGKRRSEGPSGVEAQDRRAPAWRCVCGSLERVGGPKSGDWICDGCGMAAPSPEESP